MIETEHRGYKIAYSETTNSWVQTDLCLSATSLAALRKKIDSTLVADDTMQLRVLLLRPDEGSGGVIPATITSITSSRHVLRAGSAPFFGSMRTAPVCQS